MMKLSDLRQLGKPGKPQDAADERDRFYQFGICGQQVDKSGLRQVIWHEQPGQEPLDLDG
ncbi:hypothetical protein [Mesorhizobium sp. B1-1-8]|uniref:hypothetical protein n=1 Tax=Mesorhizobium sp. B1-1-8 TaxID=2589976 RepID=UPI00112B98DD|nr:hypothetical protein [Mesorhizobium sp. B1-1-8]UCI10479.1 hypothetical protein FJ974_29675 [Mesorhizobium sp. B1-1-8]